MAAVHEREAERAWQSASPQWWPINTPLRPTTNAWWSLYPQFQTDLAQAQRESQTERCYILKLLDVIQNAGAQTPPRRRHQRLARFAGGLTC